MGWVEFQEILKAVGSVRIPEGWHADVSMEVAGLLVFNDIQVTFSGQMVSGEPASITLDVPYVPNKLGVERMSDTLDRIYKGQL